MEFDGLAAGGNRSLTSLLTAVVMANFKRRNRPGRPQAPKGGRRPTPGRTPNRAELLPTRSFTQTVRVESLRVYEGAGHTLSRHVNHAPNADVERLNSERGIPAAGSFYTEEIAQKSVEAAVAAYNDELRSWLNTGRAKGPFVKDLDMGEPVGSVLTRAALNDAVKRGETPVSLPANTVRIVLRKSPKFEGGFFVLTAYPVPSIHASQVPPLAVEPLSRYEGDGHTLARHVGITGADLIGRLENEDQITAASCFIDEAVAQKAVNAAIEARASEIHNWLLSGTTMPFSGNLVLSEAVGVVLTRDAFDRGRRQPSPANRVHFILGRSDKYPGGFYVKTAYPVLPY